MASTEDPTSDERTLVSKEFDGLLRQTFTTIEGLRESITWGAKILAERTIEEANQSKAKIEGLKKPDDPTKFEIPVGFIPQYEQLVRRSQIIGRPLGHYLEGIFIQCFSTLDVFVRRTYEAVLRAKPEMVAQLDLNVPLEKLVGTPDVAAILHETIGDHLNETSRPSLTTQFTELLKFCNCTLKSEGLPEWSFLAEAVQRRNLVVHGDGVVNSIYVQACKEERVPQALTLKKGEKVSLTAAYLLETVDSIQVLCCRTVSYILYKTWPSFGLGMGHDLLSNRVYDLLRSQDYREAISLGRLTCSDIFIKPHGVNQEQQLRAAINLAQAYKWTGNQDACQATLKTCDFTVANETFQLALLALSDKHQELAAHLPPDVTSNNWQAAFLWPLYREFRKSAEFVARYKEVFETDFKTG